ncbi:hypothetical protein GCM10010531_44710 [Blastococcus jejuensis]|uniref:Uncharacterized protein n=1 Tax=Blastococcus jejuensis TaxID=351224 RepID=A0ABP6PPS7_9ACTN
MLLSAWRSNGLTCRRLIADERASPVRLLDDIQRGTQLSKVPVVDATVVELMSQLEKQLCPFPARRGRGYVNLERTFDDPYCRPS